MCGMPMLRTCSTSLGEAGSTSWSSQRANVLAVSLQIEIDYKQECAAGDTVDCFGARLTEPSAAAANVNGTGASHWAS